MFILAHRRKVLNIFNIVILGFSSAGIMGWAFWKDFPLIACIIVSLISLLKLISPHIVPSDKQIDKLDEITDFYFDYFKDYCTKTEQFEEITVKIFGISPEGFPTKNQKKVLYRCSSEHCF